MSIKAYYVNTQMSISFVTIFLKLIVNMKNITISLSQTPPFNKNQDIDHIQKMFSCLKKGGKLISIASKSWFYGNQKKQVAFREWLSMLGATIEKIENGAFKKSGTNVGGVYYNNL
jgi:uncharacterized protein YecE (DUF72 family)